LLSLAQVLGLDELLLHFEIGVKLGTGGAFFIKVGDLCSFGLVGLLSTGVFGVIADY